MLWAAFWYNFVQKIKEDVYGVDYDYYLLMQCECVFFKSRKIGTKFDNLSNVLRFGRATYKMATPKYRKLFPSIPWLLV